MYSDFYKNGITNINFGNERLDSVLDDILNRKLKDNFSLTSKYPKTFDLRPDVINYDPIFLESLKIHNVKNILRAVTLKDLSLFHVQVRVVEDNNSYMNWHRDTYYNHTGDLIGKAPHAIKIIYYPDLKSNQNDRLLYLLGSNRIVFPDNKFDNELFKILPVTKIQTSNSNAVLFDVNGLHAVCPEKESKSIRLIYSFLSKQQIIDDHKNDQLHMETMEAYERI